VAGAFDNSYTGAGWVYTRSGGVWTEQGNKLVGTGAVNPAYQGYSVALSGDGNTAIVGGYSDNNISEARRKQPPIYGETLHQYLLYTANDYKRPNGQIYHTYPSLKSADDQAALWDGTA
jgi:hypothetical protein